MPCSEDLEAVAAPSALLPRPGLLVCPLCGAPLAAVEEGAELRCSGCGEAYAWSGGVPRLYRPAEGAVEDVTARVKSFYEESPFPDYEDLDSAASLQAKARRGLFARLLDEQVPARAWVLDAGCGTGQLTNFLALAPQRTVVGADVCQRSLELAEAFRLENRIDGASFVQMNLFRPALAPASFHLVISNGVLHHTGDPRGGFRSLARLVRPGGFFAVGLYNTFGRLPTDLRRLVFRLTGDRLRFLDPRLRAAGLGAARQRSWFLDQYKHPHESKHTLSEVLAWLDDSGFDFVNAVPRAKAFASFSASEQLFVPQPRGGALDHFLTQLGMLLRGGAEGGLFVVIGRKRG